jgi:hypothetical protein
MTKVDICNKALTLLGAAPITSIDDDTATARSLNRVYDISLESILHEAKWNFATKRDLLSEVEVTLDWYDPGESFVYSKPSDAVWIYEANSNASWRIEGDYIISDTSGLGVRYIYLNEDPSTYPATFADAFIDKLASEIAFYVLNSPQKAEAMLQKYTTMSLPKAKSRNSQVGVQQKVRDDAWELAKYSDGALDA